MTTDLYVSYASDDDLNGMLSAKINMFCRQFKLVTGHNFNVVFHDSKTHKFDQNTAELEITSSTLFLIIRTPTYYNENDTNTLFELKKIFEKNKAKKQFIAFSIDLYDINVDEIKAKYHDNPTYSDAVNYSLVLPSISGQEIDNPNSTDVRNFVNFISECLTKEDPNRFNTTSNCRFHKIAIDTIDMKYKEIKAEIKKANENNTKKPVCVIYTGGTVGMIRQDDSDENSTFDFADIESAISYKPKIWSLPHDIDFYSYSTLLDSSNIDSKDWGKLADIIKLLYPYYKGVVILHGSNTMAYTASALSFMLGEGLAKPVILTGSEIPISETQSDAEQNIIRAITTVGSEDSSFIKEVCVLYGDVLLRGNRTTRKNANKPSDAFYSPNYQNLGTYEYTKMSLNYRFLRSSNGNQDSINPEYENIPNSNIYIIDVFPGMDLSLFDAIADCVKNNKSGESFGLIIRTYGTGNAPYKKNEDSSESFLKKIKKLIDLDVIVINLTQCTEGRVELRLFETNAGLFDIGVINGGDMTKEAAYCKLKCLFSLKKSFGNEKIIQDMQEDAIGELTYNAYTIKQSSDDEKPFFVRDEKHEEINHDIPVFIGEEHDFSEHNITYPMIENAVFRIEGIKLLADSPINANVEITIKVYLSMSKRLEEKELICKLKKTMDIDESGIPKPLEFTREVTETIRKLFIGKIKRASIKIASESNHRFSFRSTQLTIFTRVPWAITTQNQQLN